MEYTKLILLLLPVILINCAVVIYCVIDILKEDRVVKGGNKLIWILAVGLVNPFGWLLYLIIGRVE
ncbi:PLD nuclease N-terminal domain-containing protein [Mycoplasmatota bacterium WC44]